MTQQEMREGIVAINSEDFVELSVVVSLDVSKLISVAGEHSPGHIALAM